MDNITVEEDILDGFLEHMEDCFQKARHYRVFFFSSPSFNLITLSDLHYMGTSPFLSTIFA